MANRCGRGSRGWRSSSGGCEYDRLHAMFADEFERVTTQVRLVGADTDGLGEDISVFREDGTTLHETRPSLPLEGEGQYGIEVKDPEALAALYDHVLAAFPDA